MTPDPFSVLIFAPNWLGDAVMALPAIADVRRRYPSARLVIAARAGIADLFTLVPGVDDIITLRWKGRWWARAAMREDAARLSAVGAGVAVLLPNSFSTAWLASRAGVPERWGYARDMRGRLLTRAVPPPRHSLHQAAYYQHLTHALAVPAGPLEPELQVPATAVDEARRLLVTHGWDEGRPIIVLAPGAAYGTAKRWIPDHVATLVTDLVRRREASCVLVGSRADRATTSSIRHGMGSDVISHVIDIAGETSLAALAGVLTLAQACVANDSGAMHLAAAIGVPIAAVFGPTREHETAPLSRGSRPAAVLTHPVWCRPCMLRECPIDHRCMTRVTPDKVFTTIEQMMTGVAR